MPNIITPDLFEHLVQLAALELEPEEAGYLRKELNNQLKAIHELEAIPLEKNTPLASHGVPYTRMDTSSCPTSLTPTWNNSSNSL
jgi:aspartyl-tRNA(Asn)/glutamyl-tRNA(Gln) amidotransferase subunit C